MTVEQYMMSVWQQLGPRPAQQDDVNFYQESMSKKNNDSL